MSQVTLLFLNAHRLSLNTSSIPSDIPLLKKYLLENWSSDFNKDSSSPQDIPQNIDQLRFIHLGRQLSNESIQDLNLELSNIIHVSLKPLSKGLNKKKSNDDTINNNNNDGSKNKNKNKQNNNNNNRDQGNRENNINNEINGNSQQDQTEKGGCCIIV